MNFAEDLHFRARTPEPPKYDFGDTPEAAPVAEPTVVENPASRFTNGVEKAEKKIGGFRGLLSKIGWGKPAPENNHLAQQVTPVNHEQTVAQPDHRTTVLRNKVPSWQTSLEKVKARGVHVESHAQVHTVKRFNDAYYDLRQNVQRGKYGDPENIDTEFNTLLAQVANVNKELFQYWNNIQAGYGHMKRASDQDEQLYWKKYTEQQSQLYEKERTFIHQLGTRLRQLKDMKEWRERDALGQGEAA